jgi:hypothetical protein
MRTAIALRRHAPGVHCSSVEPEKRPALLVTIIDPAGFLVQWIGRFRAKSTMPQAVEPAPKKPAGQKRTPSGVRLGF